MSRSEDGLYLTAFGMCGLLFVMAPPAGVIMSMMVAINWIDDISTRARPRSPDNIVEITRHKKDRLGTWDHEEATGLETLRVEHHCRCHEHMGNDFYFLPMGNCLYYKDCPNGKY